MAMSTPTTTTTPTDDAALLQLMWLASPALPVGGFSYSEGLESAVDAGLVRDEASAARWLVDQLHLTLARSDLAVVAQALRAWRAADAAAIAALNAWVQQTRETAELRQQTTQMGRSLGEWRKGLAPAHILPELPMPRTEPLGAPLRATDHAYPIAFACAAGAGPAGERGVLAAFAFGWAENMMQAAIKAVPLGQNAGQRILAQLAAEIPQAIDHALALGEAGRQCFSPMLAILSARHETQYSRLFRS